MVALLRGIACRGVFSSAISPLPGRQFHLSSPSDALPWIRKVPTMSSLWRWHSAPTTAHRRLCRHCSLEPVLATAWDRVRMIRWRIKLRPSVRFHEGQPFTADDVFFTVTRGSPKRADTRQELDEHKERDHGRRSDRYIPHERARPILPPS